MTSCDVVRDFILDPPSLIFTIFLESLEVIQYQVKKAYRMLMYPKLAILAQENWKKIKNCEVEI